MKPINIQCKKYIACKCYQTENLLLKSWQMITTELIPLVFATNINNPKWSERLVRWAIAQYLNITSNNTIVSLVPLASLLTSVRPSNSFIVSFHSLTPGRWMNESVERAGSKTTLLSFEMKKLRLEMSFYVLSVLKWSFCTFCEWKKECNWRKNGTFKKVFKCQQVWSRNLF